MFNGSMNGAMPAHYMNGGWESAGHHGWGFMHGPVSILLFIGVIALSVWLFRRVFYGQSVCHQGGATSALSTLSERFAKGEIDEEEFRTKREVLKSRK